LFYVGLKFLSELLSNIRQWPFSYIAATAEKEITRKVYTHVQNQSLQYHVCRETGKILRAVQRGSASFVAILNVVLFLSLPTVIKLVLVTVTVGVLYDKEFLYITFGSMALYVVSNYLMTQYKAKYYKKKSDTDRGTN